MNEYEKDINAIHERDIDKFLQQEGIEDAFKRGDIHCKFCGSKITKENVHSILPESGAFNFICQKDECVAMLMAYLDDKDRA